MGSVKLFALSSCMSLVIGAILSMIMPNLDKNKIFRVVLSAFTLIGLVSPIITLFNNNDIPKKAYTDQTSEYERYDYSDSLLQNIENTASESIYPIIHKELNKLGIAQEFGLKLNISPQKEGIEIESVNIFIWDSHSIENENLEKQIAQNTGLPINVELIGGEYR